MICEIRLKTGTPYGVPVIFKGVSPYEKSDI